MFHLPRPMLHSADLNFSFSGLKTAVLTLVREQGDAPLDEAFRANAARAFQEAIVEVLVRKSLKAMKQSGLKQLVVAGGVGANKRLREKLHGAAQRRGGRVCFPRPALCTDNGAMIAFAGALRLEAGQHDDAAVHVTPRWDMATLPAV